MIPYGRQDISEQDIEAVLAVLKSDWLTQGPTIEKFEREVARRCGVPHAVAVANATAALHLGALALGLGPGDFLWTSPNTFVASANAGLYCGASVDFVDIDSRTYNMSVDALEAKLTRASAEGRLPKLVVPVHFAGQSCEMDRIRALSRQYGFKVMEDASHAIGGRYRGLPVGSCEHSDLTVFSFHPVKIITTGEGGMILTRDAALADVLRRLRTHGITRDPALMTEPSHGPWYYQQVSLGMNYRMTDLQAALGLSQLGRIDQFIARRHQLVKRYEEAFEGFPLVRPWQHSETYSAFHLYVIRLKRDLLRKSRRKVFEELQAAGIGVNVHYIPVHLQPYYRKLGFALGQFPESERYYEDAITLPLYSGLSDAEQDQVISSLRRVLGA